MTYPIAEKFKDGTFTKPTLKKNEFYKGGLFAMQERLQKSLLPFPGAFREFTERAKDLEDAFIISKMWDYIRLE